MKKYFVFFISIVFGFLFLSSCKEKNNNQNSHNNADTSLKFTVDIKKYDNYAKFICGIPCENFEDFQQKDFYKNYANSTATNWNYFYVNQILVITNWAEKNEVLLSDDTITAFYPFAGPDFSFVYAFYPYSNNYLLVGLENIGQVPDLQNYTDIEIAELLNSMTQSLVDFFAQGYFNTQNMKNNFRNNNVNGVIHPLLYFIYQTNHQITDLKYFVIDDFGKILYVQDHQTLDKRIKGVKISISGNKGKKDVYYLQVDLSDVNFLNHPELVTFISNFGNKNTFLKSASYLLQEDKLSLFRELLINQSVKILQDDSGFSYKFLKENNFTISVFGKYTRTLNLFQTYWQPDLKQEFDKQNSKKLPFRFGYNVPFDETAIIYAQKNNSQEIIYPVYKVQFRMSWNKLPQDSLPLHLGEIDYYFDEGYYKYTVGNFSSKQECEVLLEKVRQTEFKDAFIVEFDEISRRTLE